MNELQAFLLGAIQGVTEFLPISSSGHLVLFQEWMGLDTGSLKSFDVMVHVGSLLAIVIYFWKDVLVLIKGVFQLMCFKINNEAKMFLKISAATIPAIYVGLFWADSIDAVFRDQRMVFLMFLFVAMYFILAESFKGKVKTSSEKLGFQKAILIGIAQSIAIIPGVSRSGSTISTGLLLGMKRDDAAKFSFLLGIPAILGAGIVTAFEAANGASLGAEWSAMIIGFLSSFVFGIVSIVFLMKFLKNHSLKVFAFYLILMSVVGFIIVG